MKRFEKKLDNYYSNKLKIVIEEELSLWYLDYKFQELGNVIYLFVKQKKYNDEQYHIILRFEKEKALYYIANGNDTRKEIQEMLKDYDKWENKKSN